MKLLPFLFVLVAITTAVDVKLQLTATNGNESLV